MHPGPKAEVFKGILCSEGEDVDVELDDKHFGRGIRLEEFVWRNSFGGIRLERIRLEEFVWRNSFGGIRLEEFVWRGFVWRNSFGGIRLERNSFDPRF